MTQKRRRFPGRSLDQTPPPTPARSVGHRNKVHISLCRLHFGGRTTRLTSPGFFPSAAAFSLASSLAFFLSSFFFFLRAIFARRLRKKNRRSGRRVAQRLVLLAPPHRVLEMTQRFVFLHAGATAV